MADMLVIETGSGLPDAESQASVAVADARYAGCCGLGMSGRLLVVSQEKIEVVGAAVG